MFTMEASIKSRFLNIWQPLPLSLCFVYAKQVLYHHNISQPQYLIFKLFCSVHVNSYFLFDRTCFCPSKIPNALIVIFHWLSWACLFPTQSQSSSALHKYCRRTVMWSSVSASGSLLSWISDRPVRSLERHHRIEEAEKLQCQRLSHSVNAYPLCLPVLCLIMNPAITDHL